jgi:predicted transposase YbfD/YdcC
MPALREGLGLKLVQGVVAVDGKNLRHGYEKGRAYLPLLMISVWDTQTRVAMAQARAPGANEVAATLELLGSLVLKGCTVTGDALHCHPAMAQAVLDTKADYALGLKANKGPLYADAERAFAAAGAEAATLATEENTHGRIEWRRAGVLPADGGARLAAWAEGVRPHRSRTHRHKRQAGHGHALNRTLAQAHTGQNGRSCPRPLGHRKSTALDSRRRIRRGRRATRKDYGPENLAVIRRLAQNPPTLPSAAKCAALCGAKTSSTNSLLICDSPGGHRGTLLDNFGHNRLFRLRRSCPGMTAVEHKAE